MRFLIIDDHEVFREGLAALLRRTEPGCDVLSAGDGAEGLNFAELHDAIDAVFIDLQMPGIGGVALIEAFGKQYPGLPLIVLSSSEDPVDVRNALASGALGYVPKSVNSKTLLAALRMVLRGDVYVPTLMLGKAATAVAAPARLTGPAELRLTERQVDVLRLIERGLTNKDIANALDLSEKTVKVHVTGIFRALNVVNRTQAAIEARKAELA